MIGFPLAPVEEDDVSLMSEEVADRVRSVLSQQPLKGWLENHGLLRVEQALLDLGATRAFDVIDMTFEDVARLGLRPLEQKRWAAGIAGLQKEQRRRRPTKEASLAPPGEGTLSNTDGLVEMVEEDEPAIFTVFDAIAGVASATVDVCSFAAVDMPFEVVSSVAELYPSDSDDDDGDDDELAAQRVNDQNNITRHWRESADSDGAEAFWKAHGAPNSNAPNGGLPGGYVNEPAAVHDALRGTVVQLQTMATQKMEPEKAPHPSNPGEKVPPTTGERSSFFGRLLRRSGEKGLTQ